MLLEELLHILSGNLVVRTARKTVTSAGNMAYRYMYEEVSEEVKMQFEDELRNHLSVNPYSNMIYSFGYWDDEDARIVRSTLHVNNITKNFPRQIVIPQQPLNLGANANLKKIFSKLPKLEHGGDEYGFRCETIFIVYYQPLKENVVSDKKLSPWIKAQKKHHF